MYGITVQLSIKKVQVFVFYIPFIAFAYGKGSFEQKGTVF